MLGPTLGPAMGPAAGTDTDIFDATADMLYAKTRSRARLAQIWATVTGRPRHLLDLAEVAKACTVRARYSAGLRTVAISDIRGSEGRSQDFDRSFRPLRGYTEGRWRSVARAQQQGRFLPAIELIQVGDVYFVRDGHHRLSVARALGQHSIEARVTVWQVEAPLPWEAQVEVAGHCLHPQPA